jgi:hypothetical protein
MKTLSKKIRHARSHTWKDIGGLSGLLLDTLVFVPLLIVSLVFIIIGSVTVVFDFVFSPLLAMVGRCRQTHKSEESPTDFDPYAVPPTTPEKKGP